MDQTTEITVNKDTQTPGGTTQFSLKAGAIKRYYITAEHRSAFLSQIRGIVQGKKSEFQHAELQRTRIKKMKKQYQQLFTSSKDGLIHSQRNKT